MHDLVAHVHHAAVHVEVDEIAIALLAVFKLSAPLGMGAILNVVHHEDRVEVLA